MMGKVSMGTPAPRTARGFTAVELMVVLAIIGILTAVALPSFRDAVQRTRVTAYANDLVAAALRARGEAIKRNVVITMCPSTTGTACGGSNWAAGYVLRCASADGTTCDPLGAATETMVLHAQPALPAGWRIHEANSVVSVAFQPSGTGATAATMTVCQHTPVGRQERVITIGPTGRATVTRTTNGSCPGG